MSRRSNSRQSSGLPLAITRQVDALCDAYEAILEADPSAPIGSLVQRVEPAGRDFLVQELVALAHDKKLRTGSSNPVSEILDSNPEMQAEITQAFAQRNGANRPSARGFSAECPNCGSTLQVQPDADLQNIPCAACGQSFKIAEQPGPTRDARRVGTVSQFELIERVGMGSFGSVWKAVDTKLERTVAIKLPKTGQFNERQEKDFLKEARAAAQLSHPGIVPVYEVGRDGDTLYIVTEFVRGLTLADWLTGHHPAPREAVELIVQVCDALHHAHERGVIHRDIKPGNVMIGEDGNARIMDFGLAKRESSDATMSLDGYIVGTPAYMSPEQARGDNRASDRRCDIYSVGVLLYQMLTGEPPFRGNIRMLLHQVLNEEPPSVSERNPSVPADLEAAVMRCLEKAPSARFATAADLGDALRAWLDGKPLQTPEATQHRSKLGMNKAIAATTAVALALTAVIAVLGVKSAWYPRESVPTEPSKVDQRATGELDELKAKRRKLEANKSELEEELERLRSDMYRLAPPPGDQASATPRLAASALYCWSKTSVFMPSVRAGLATTVAQLRSSTVTEPTQVSDAPSLDIGREIDRLKDYNAQLSTDITRLKSEAEAAKRELAQLQRFNDADFILLEGEQSAVAVTADNGGFLVSATASGPDMLSRLQGMMTRGRRAVILDRTTLARKLRKIGSGNAVNSADAIESLREVWAPREYVPIDVSENDMVCVQRADRRFGSDQYMIGYLQPSYRSPELRSDRNGSITIYTTAKGSERGKMEISRRDVLGYPVIAEGEELLQLEPRISVFDYIILRAAHALSSKDEKAVHQAVAVRTVVKVNPALIKRLSAYSSESDISWLAVARDDERMARNYDGQSADPESYESRQVLERLAGAAEAELKRAASALKLPLVTRDRKAMHALVREVSIRQGGSELPTARRVLSAMRAAADRGNLQYAWIEHEDAKRRVVMQKQDEQRFKNYARQRGAHSWQGQRAGFRGDAWGGGRGYGGGGAVRRTANGLEYGYGGGSGWGGGHLSVGASAARNDYIYHNDQIYASQGQQSYLDELNDDEARDAYRSVVFGEQVAKRDEDLRIADYGRLANATHVLSLTVTDGLSPGTVSYVAELQAVDGGYSNTLVEIEQPIDKATRSVDFLAAAGDLCVANPRIRPRGGPRGSYLPLAINPLSMLTRGKAPALAMRRIPNGDSYQYRQLFGNQPIDVGIDAFSGIPSAITVGNSLSSVPESNRLRVAMYEVARRIKNPAGEVTSTEADGSVARAQMISADRYWKPGERLVAYRQFSDGTGTDFVRLPFDLAVARCTGDIATLLCDDPADLLWQESTGLQVGDLVCKRVSNEGGRGSTRPRFLPS